MRERDSKKNRMHDRPSLHKPRARRTFGRDTNRPVSESFPSGVAGCVRVVGLVLISCVPAGNSTPSDAGPSNTPAPSSGVRQAPNVMTAVLEDSFGRASGGLASAVPPTSEGGGTVAEGGGSGSEGGGSGYTQNG